MSADKVEWRQYKTFSGPMVKSTVTIPIPVVPRVKYHVDRAYWLTTKVETGGTFGTVMAYDGTGMTAGPDQHIAVYPAELAHEDYNAENDQGSLWQLLRRLEAVSGSATYAATLKELLSNLEAKNLYLSQEGKLRYREAGVSVVAGKKIIVKAGATAHGAVIRELFTPLNGTVPQTGPLWEQASHWALRFHQLFVQPEGYKAQLEFGKEHLVVRTKSRKLAALGLSIEAGIYQQEISNVSLGYNGFTEAVDLALSVFQSHSVNAPAIAATAVSLAANKQKPVLNEAFAKSLIYHLGKNSYGRWSVDEPNGRYQRTRQIAKSCGLWPTTLFEGSTAVMPKEL